MITDKQVNLHQLDMEALTVPFTMHIQGLGLHGDGFNPKSGIAEPGVELYCFDADGVPLPDYALCEWAATAYAAHTAIPAVSHQAAVARKPKTLNDPFFGG